MPLLRLPALVFLAASLSACGPDPDATAAAAYVAALGPVVAQNTALDQHFLDLAGKLRAGSVSGADVAKEVEATVLPAARAVVEAAEQIDPENPTLKAVHHKGVEVWKVRSAAYGDLSKAYKAKDLAAFDAALQTERRTRDAEAAWLSELDLALAAYGQHLDAFPKGAGR